ncbi:MAG: PH domain-containing protein [Actinomycetota bacterium]|nr:PH domain-containing protein [Actinomycetota bacterium]
MAYPEGLLASDEQVVKHLHPHWITLAGPIFALVVVGALAGLGITFVPDGDARRWLRLAILVVAVLLVIVFFLVPLLRWITTHYVITSHRVMFRIGVLKRDGKDIALPRITNVAYSQSLWDRIVNSGTLTIESAGESSAQVLTNIPHSDEVQQLINRLVEEDETRRSREAGQYYQQQAVPPSGPDLGREATRYLPPS